MLARAPSLSSQSIAAEAFPESNMDGHFAISLSQVTVTQDTDVILPETDHSVENSPINFTLTFMLF